MPAVTPPAAPHRTAEKPLPRGGSRTDTPGVTGKTVICGGIRFPGGPCRELTNLQRRAPFRRFGAHRDRKDFATRFSDSKKIPTGPRRAWQGDGGLRKKSIASSRPYY